MTPELETLIADTIERETPLCAVEQYGYKEMRFNVKLHYLTVQLWESDRQIRAELTINGSNRRKIVEFSKSPKLIAAFNKVFADERERRDAATRKHVEQCNSQNNADFINAIKP